MIESLTVELAPNKTFTFQAIDVEKRIEQAVRRTIGPEKTRRWLHDISIWKRLDNGGLERVN